MNLHERLSFNKYFSHDTAKYQHFNGSILPYQQKKICYFSISSTQIKLKNIFSVRMSVWYITSGIKYVIFHMLFEAFHITSRFICQRCEWRMLETKYVGFGHFCHQHPLSLYISIGHQHSKDVHFALNLSKISIKSLYFFLAVISLNR